MRSFAFSFLFSAPSWAEHAKNLRLQLNLNRIPRRDQFASGTFRELEFAAEILIELLVDH